MEKIMELRKGSEPNDVSSRGRLARFPRELDCSILVQGGSPRCWGERKREHGVVGIGNYH